MLSISCLSSPSHVPDKVGGLEFLLKHSLEVFNAVASENAIGTARILLGDHGGNSHKAVHRIDTQVAPGRFSLDATAGIRELKSLGKNKALHEFTKIQNIFFDTTTEPFTPVSENRL